MLITTNKIKMSTKGGFNKKGFWQMLGNNLADVAVPWEDVHDLHYI